MILNKVKRAFVKVHDAPRRKMYEALSEILRDDPVIHVKEFCGDFSIDRRSTLFRRIMIKGYYEPALVASCLKNLPHEKDVIDIGANVGFYSILLAQKISHSSRVLAIEPTDNAFGKLEKNVALNNVREKIISYNGVASDISGELEIRTVLGKEEYSSIGVMEHPSIAKESYVTHKVPSETIDNLVKTHGLQPGFVKIDVEGAEKRVFDGAKDTIREHRPVVLSEISDKLLRKNGSSAVEVFSFFESQSYKIVNPMKPHKEVNSDYNGDILCLPSGISV